jgi:hypothetical protein
MLTLTEITDGFTRSTMSAKPTGLRDLADFVVDLRVRRAGEDIDRAGRRAETIERRTPRPATTEAISANLRAETASAAGACRTEARKDRRDVQSF